MEGTLRVRLRLERRAHRVPQARVVRDEVEANRVGESVGVDDVVDIAEDVRRQVRVEQDGPHQVSVAHRGHAGGGDAAEESESGSPPDGVEDAHTHAGHQHGARLNCHDRRRQSAKATSGANSAMRSPTPSSDSMAATDRAAARPSP